MRALYWTASDALAMIGRSIRHATRSIDALTMAILLPVMLLLLFVYVFGGAIRSGAAHYVDYIVPGIILLCAGFGSASTAVAVCEDMTTGAIDRFRSLPIAASSVLTGHVVASLLRNALSTAIVLGVALAIGFHPAAGVSGWLAVLGVLLLFMAAVSWIAACFGLLVRSAEAAGAFSMVMTFVPYVSSAFVPPETMPRALRWIAEHQPVTPVIETLRALMAGAHAGDAGLALAWCGGAALAGWLGASALFRRRTA